MFLSYSQKIFISKVYKKINLLNKKNNFFRTLMYHSVYDDSIENDNKIMWRLGLSLFKEQIKFIKENKNNKIYKSEVLLSNAPLNGISITFDDGNIDCYNHVAPFLLDLKIPFSIFVITNFIKNEKKGYMNKSILKEMSENPYISIGSHTKNHYSLTNCSETTIYSELNDSKLYLEDLLGKEIVMFSYPHGKVNKFIEKKVSQTGYKLAFSSKFNVNKVDENKLALCRNEIWNTDSMQIFKQKLNGDWDWMKYRNF